MVSIAARADPRGTGPGRGPGGTRRAFGVVDDDLAGGLEPAHGQAVIVGLTARPHDGEPARPRKVPRHSRCGARRSRAPPPGAAGSSSSSARMASSTSALSRCLARATGPARRPRGGSKARRPSLGSGVTDAPGLGRVVDAPRDDLAAVAADGQADDAAGVAAESENILAV